MTAGDFAVLLEQTEPVVVLRATGEMDAATVNRLDTALEQTISEHDGHVVIDATTVTFIDSTGVTSLISGLRRLNRSRRRLALAFAGGSPIARALEVTGLDHTFECHGTVDDAVATLAAAPLIGR